MPAPSRALDVPQGVLIKTELESFLWAYGRALENPGVMSQVTTKAQILTVEVVDGVLEIRFYKKSKPVPETREYMRLYHLAHRDEKAAYNRAYRKANKQTIRAKRLAAAGSPLD